MGRFSSCKKTSSKSSLKLIIDYFEKQNFTFYSQKSYFVKYFGHNFLDFLDFDDFDEFIALIILKYSIYCTYLLAAYTYCHEI